MATVTEAAITEPITVDAACQTTSPSISIKEEERRVMKQQASALHLCRRSKGPVSQLIHLIVMDNFNCTCHYLSSEPNGE